MSKPVFGRGARRKRRRTRQVPPRGNIVSPYIPWAVVAARRLWMPRYA